MVKKSVQKGGINPAFVVVAIVLVGVGIAVTSRTGDQVSPSLLGVFQTKSAVATKTYTSQRYGVSLEYTDGWSKKENLAAGIVVAFGSPKESATDKFVDNINVSVSDLSSQPDMTIDQVADAWLKETEGDLPSGAFNVLENKFTTMAGAEAKRLVYTYTMQGKTMKGMVVMTLIDTTVYLVTYTAEKASYDKFVSAMNTVVTSLQVN